MEGLLDPMDHTTFLFSQSRGQLYEQLPRYSVASSVANWVQIVMAGAPEGNRRDCNTMEKQRGGR
jgi:hypothetical protein